MGYHFITDQVRNTYGTRMLKVLALLLVVFLHTSSQGPAPIPETKDGAGGDENGGVGADYYDPYSKCSAWPDPTELKYGITCREENGTISRKSWKDKCLWQTCCVANCQGGVRCQVEKRGD